MKINFSKYYMLRSLLLASLLAVCGHTQAQTQVAPPPRGTAAIGHVDMVLARPLDAIDRSGGGLVLPDGSVIKTIWPAALEVTTITDNPKWVNQPVRPRCEPAVYSLARIMPDGKELWAKSYIFKGKVTQICFAQYLGFDVHSALSEVEAPGFYLLPFNGRFFAGDPTDPNKIEIDAATGTVFGVSSKNLRVIDAYELRAIKRNIQVSLEAKFPEPEVPRTNSSKASIKEYGVRRYRAERTRKHLLFERLGETLFPTVDGTPINRP